MKFKIKNRVIISRLAGEDIAHLLGNSFIVTDYRSESPYPYSIRNTDGYEIAVKEEEIEIDNAHFLKKALGLL
jgi:hypothetical protein